MGINDTGSWTQAASSIKTYEKCPESKCLSAPLALVKQPDVSKVHTTTLYWYKNWRFGKRNSPFLQLLNGSMDRLNFSLLNVLAYRRNSSPTFKTWANRSVISSQALLECAVTNMCLLVVRTISSMAPTSVLVLPVPITKIELFYFW